MMFALGLLITYDLSVKRSFLMWPIVLAECTDVVYA
jgi:hypothetical protein